MCDCFTNYEVKRFEPEHASVFKSSYRATSGEENYDPNKPSIKEFYAGRDIFITGGTGFMGKVLIEKLLRSCSGLNRIFILLREKKSKTTNDRLREIQELPLFEVLRRQDPNALSKMIPIKGDVSQLELGMSDEDRKRMSEVSVIFHVAANVRFDDPLKDAVILNTRGTREMIRFAESLKNLCVMMHVSTTYSNPDKYIIEEKIYPPYADWEKTIKLAEEMDTQTLETFAPKYMGMLPNTYVFTKSLAEHIINDYRDRLPLILFRPSIVISSMRDPIPGWIDNFNGPVGLLVGSGIGLCRTMYCDPNNVADYTPVDVCIKAMIVAAWKKGTAVVQR
ncbi:putative fatty acyl-CoA reductase CG5065 [Aedes aegypti]|uniref:Fatty acyl-CoA reductase n=1 Tax=Aedes aegypti TaxID=7159 RepID=A0A903VSE9_AEDAE|nr:putative fatty acyl-CoA reductase CG5065 [Aedes aegypti]